MHVSSQVKPTQWWNDTKKTLHVEMCEEGNHDAQETTMHTCLLQLTLPFPCLHYQTGHLGTDRDLVEKFPRRHNRMMWVYYALLYWGCMTALKCPAHWTGSRLKTVENSARLGYSIPLKSFTWPVGEFWLCHCLDRKDTVEMPAAKQSSFHYQHYLCKTS